MQMFFRTDYDAQSKLKCWANEGVKIKIRYWPLFIQDLKSLHKANLMQELYASLQIFAYSISNILS